MYLPNEWSAKTIAGAKIIAAQDYADDINLGWFDPNNGKPVSQGGRQAAWFVANPAYGNAVLRYYRRGGLRAKLGSESYFWLGQNKVRSVIEIKALEHLRSKNVLVPEPIACAYWLKGLWYKNAILVKCIPNAVTLAANLENIAPDAVAQAIKNMHDAGVWHADLNANNIMCDTANNIWLIDFDRAQIRHLSAKDKANNYLRLRRSLEKLFAEKGLNWWQKFMAAI